MPESGRPAVLPQGTPLAAGAGAVRRPGAGQQLRQELRPGVRGAHPPAHHALRRRDPRHGGEWAWGWGVCHTMAWSATRGVRPSTCRTTPVVCACRRAQAAQPRGQAPHPSPSLALSTSECHTRIWVVCMCVCVYVCMPVNTALKGGSLAGWFRPVSDQRGVTPPRSGVRLCRPCASGYDHASTHASQTPPHTHIQPSHHDTAQTHDTRGPDILMVMG